MYLNIVKINGEEFIKIEEHEEVKKELEAKVIILENMVKSQKSIFEGLDGNVLEKTETIKEPKMISYTEYKNISKMNDKLIAENRKKEIIISVLIEKIRSDVY